MTDQTNRVSHYSFSSLKSFKNCPYSWWLDKVLGQKLPSSAAASFGSQFDQLVAHKLGLEPSDTRGDDKPITEVTLCEGVEEAVDIYLLQDFSPKFAVAAQKKITIDPVQWAIMGESFGLSLEISKPFIGYIDLMERQGLQRKIIDLKTSKRKGMRAEWAEQIITYCLAEQCPRGEVHLLTTTKTPAVYRYPVIITDETKAWVMANMTYYANQMEKALAEGSGENLPRNPDYWCSWCPACLECPAKAAAL